MLYRLLTIALFILVASGHARAELIEYPWFGFQSWTQDVESFHTIDFTGFPQTTFITNQYQEFGVTFTNAVFTHHDPDNFSDEWGLVGLNGIRLEFDSPQYWIAVHHLGVIMFELSYQGEVIATSSLFSHVSNPKFAGIISDQPFDEVYFFKPNPPYSNNVVSLDTLYFGAPIPAPGALGLFALAALGNKRRRR